MTGQINGMSKRLLAEFLHPNVSNTHMMKILPLVSIITPVYNAQDTLERTLLSLRRQTYGHIEFICVNDASSDLSLAMLNVFAHAVDGREGFTVKIISHPQNKGVSAARNTGLNHASGEFILYVDADDSLETDAVESCVQEALRTGADIVYFQWCLVFQNSERTMLQPTCATPLEAIQAMLAGRMRWNLWLFMVRRSLYEAYSIRFIPGANMGEDLLVTLKLFVHAAHISLLDRVLYHYRQDNAGSISKTFSTQHMREVETNIGEIERYLGASQYASAIGPGIDFLKLTIKLPLLVTGQKSDYIRWTNWFSSSDRYILQNRSASLHTRLLQWFASKRQYWAVRMYHLLLLRVFYGIIYK